MDIGRSGSGIRGRLAIQAGVDDGRVLGEKATSVRLSGRDNRGCNGVGVEVFP